jgi:predicted transcriptional regulator of viral defense system
MNLLESYRELKKFGKPTFDVSEIASILKINKTYASQISKRLANSKMAFKIMRGKWSLEQDLPLGSMIETLTYPLPSYISFHSALYIHGIIDQIPEITYCATLGRTRLIKTVFGTASFHHIRPELFFSYERDLNTSQLVATKEKAIFDFLYFSYGKSKWFKYLPEVEIQRKEVDTALINNWIENISHTQRRNFVRKKFLSLFKRALIDD